MLLEPRSGRLDSASTELARLEDIAALVPASSLDEVGEHIEAELIDRQLDNRGLVHLITGSTTVRRTASAGDTAAERAVE